MNTKITNLFNKYQQGQLNRRNFIKKLAIITGSMATATSIFPVLLGNKAQAAVLTDDPDLFTADIKFPGETGDVKAFLARPIKIKKYAAVIVIHENKGLQPHIREVSRRMAKEGFLAIAPDALSPMGGTPDNDVEKAKTMMRKLDKDKTTKNFVAAVKYLETHPESTGKVGCTGFCWGGAMTNNVAVASPDLDAAVPYYGRQPKAENVLKIKAPIMAHYGENDERINKGIPAFEEALKKAGIDYQIFVYKGAGHAFNNDSNPGRYHKKAAKLAWKRTVNFFKEKLTV